MYANAELIRKSEGQRWKEKPKPHLVHKFIIYGPSELPIFSLFIFFLFSFHSISVDFETSEDRKALTEKRPKIAFLCKLTQATSSTFNIKVNVRNESRFRSMFTNSNHVFFTFLLLCQSNCVNQKTQKNDVRSPTVGKIRLLCASLDANCWQ